MAKKMAGGLKPWPASREVLRQGAQSRPPRTQDEHKHG
ncbi:hypothetical protein CsSME_00031741 [Camellia sinensis var. sinensis]